MSSLNSEQVALQLAYLPNWSLDGNGIVKTYVFADFVDVINFMVRVAFIAQDLEHYPIWQHDVSASTLRVRIGDDNQHAVHSRDIQLAKRIEESLSATLKLTSS